MDKEKYVLHLVSLLSMMFFGAVVYYVVLWPTLMLFAAAARSGIELKGYNYIFALLPGTNWLLYLGSEFSPLKSSGAALLSVPFAFRKYGIWLTQAGVVFCWLMMRLSEQEKYKQEEVETALAKKQEEERRKRNAAEQREKNISYKKSQLEKIQIGSASSFSYLPDKLIEAHMHLDTAEKHFKNRVFIPFWDEIEKTLKSLSEFDDTVLNIKKSSIDHANLARQIGTEMYIFPITKDDINKLEASDTASRRMHDAVMKAQGDYEFSNIYLSIRTNQLLVSGFRTLSEAVENMGDRISESIELLGQSFREASDNLSGSIDDIVGAVSSMADDSAALRQTTKNLEKLSVQQIQQLKSQRQQIENANEILVKIQRTHTLADTV